MKKYVSPEMEVIRFDSDDTIITSTCDCVGAHSAVCDDCRVDNCDSDLQTKMIQGVMVF